VLATTGVSSATNTPAVAAVAAVVAVVAVAEHCIAFLRQYLYFCTSTATTDVSSATHTPAVAAVVGHCSAFRLVSICTFVLVKKREAPCSS
jgi:hypothetical protein